MAIEKRAMRVSSITYRKEGGNVRCKSQSFRDDRHSLSAFNFLFDRGEVERISGEGGGRMGMVFFYRSQVFPPGISQILVVDRAEGDVLYQFLMIFVIIPCFSYFYVFFPN